MSRPCLILLGGALPRPSLVKKAARSCREIICADGALRHAARLELRADFVVGDMDSLPARRAPSKRTVYWCDFDSERSDFHKCLDFALRRGFKTAYVAGALGGRLDHALVNLALAERAWPRLSVILLDEGSGRILGPGRHALALRRGAIFSLLPLPQAKASLSGCEYPLKNARLERSSRGLSNRACGPVKLKIHAGRLWFFSPDI